MVAPRLDDAPGRQLSAGRRLGRYTILGRVGHGGMGELYVARDDERPQAPPLALKVLLPHMASDPELVRMFLNEARYAALLQHPNIVAVHDVGQAGGEHFIAMELVQGPDLRILLREVARSGGLPLDVALSILAPVASALHYAHDSHDSAGRPLGLVHRDVSPSNVVIGSDGIAKLVDFGLVKALHQTTVTRTGVLKGKIGYMAPEQLASGQPVDRRTDVFAMGVLLFECTTCRRLFVGDNEFEVMNKVARGEVVPPTTIVPGYPPRLESIISRALQTDPAERHPTAAALVRDLQEFAREHSIALGPDRVAMVLRRFDLVGPQASIGAITIPRRGGTAPAFGTPAEQPRRARLRPGTVGLGTLTLGLGLALGLQLRDSEPPPTETGGSTVVPGDTNTPSPSSPAAVTPEPESAVAFPPEDSRPSQAPADESEVLEAAPEPEPAMEATPAPAKKKKRRRPRSSARTKPSTDPLESLLPQGGR
ncbi:MAG: protein kinase [Myxococcota bacterium]